MYRLSKRKGFSNIKVLPLAVLLLAACATAPDVSLWQRFEFNEPEMGVNFGLKFYAPNKSHARRAAKKVYKRVETLSRIFSDYNPNSELNRLTDQPVGRAVKVSSELFGILQYAKSLSLETNGAFDVTAGPYTRLWREARRQKNLTDPTLLKQTIRSVGHEKLLIKVRPRSVTCLVSEMRLDLGGIAKGWVADEALTVLRKLGINRSLCSAGGDIAIGSPPPGKKGWEVGVRALDEQGNFYDRTLSLKNCAVSTSGDTFQFIEIAGQRYSHILNPITGLGLTSRIMVTVIADKAVETDSQATAISVLGLKKGIAYAKRHRIAVMITPISDKNRKALTSPYWQKRFR